MGKVFPSVPVASNTVLSHPWRRRPPGEIDPEMHCPWFASLEQGLHRLTLISSQLGGLDSRSAVTALLVDATHAVPESS
jgi:hypothetical protein